MRVFLMLLACLFGGCAQDMHNLVQSLNDAHVSNCLFVQGAFPPYGSAYLYAKAGDLDCVSLWQRRQMLMEP